MQSKGLSRFFSNTTVQRPQFFGGRPFFFVQLSHPYMTTGKTTALTIWIFVGKVMSLLFNIMHIKSQRIQWQPTPVLLPGKSHGWRSLVGCHGVVKSQTQLNDFTLTFHFHALEKEMASHSIVLAWRIPGMAEPGGLPQRSHRAGHD